VVNALRGLLHAYGMVLPHGIPTLRALSADTRQQEQATLHTLSAARCWPRDDAFRPVENRLGSDEETRLAIGQAQPACQRRPTSPGLGPGPATARVAAMGAATPFTHGRQLAAWRGWVPRAPPSGGTPRLLGSSTRGDVSRRTVLIHGARATRRWLETTRDDRQRWLSTLLARRGQNRAAGALANMNARLVWTLLVPHPASRVRPAA
jgi:transposase